MAQEDNVLYAFLSVIVGSVILFAFYKTSVDRMLVRNEQFKKQKIRENMTLKEKNEKIAALNKQMEEKLALYMKHKDESNMLKEENKQLERQRKQLEAHAVEAFTRLKKCPGAEGFTNKIKSPVNTSIKENYQNVGVPIQPGLNMVGGAVGKRKQLRAEQALRCAAMGLPPIIPGLAGVGQQPSIWLNGKEEFKPNRGAILNILRFYIIIII